MSPLRNNHAPSLDVSERLQTGLGPSGKSSTRRRADRITYSLFIFSATVFLIEHIQRMGSEPSDHGLFDDILVIGSFIACLMLIIPIIMSIAWGINSGSNRTSKLGDNGKKNGASGGGPA